MKGEKKRITLTGYFFLIVFASGVVMYVRYFFHSKIINHVKISIIASPPFFQMTRYLMENFSCINREYKIVFNLIPGESVACVRIKAEVIGGIDLHRVKIVSNINYIKNLYDPFYEKEIRVFLPQPEVTGVNILDAEVIFLRKWEKLDFEERKNLFIQAEEELKRNAVEMGLLRETENQIKKYIELIGLKYGVRVIFETSSSTQSNERR